jgi:hypothetical protein
MRTTHSAILHLVLMLHLVQPAGDTANRRSLSTHSHNLGRGAFLRHQAEQNLTHQNSISTAYG